MTPRIETDRGLFRGVLLGEQRASKTRGQGSNPCAPARADVAEWRGPCLVSSFMPVRVRPSAWRMPLACDGRHATPRRSRTRFDSWRGYSAASPRVWRTHGGLRSRKAGFDSRVGGFSAVLFRSLSSGCDGRAHDFAKVEDQVRFLARTWPSGGGSKHKAPEPDGRTAVCKTAEAGSTPAGASHRLPRRSLSRDSPQDQGQAMSGELVD